MSSARHDQAQALPQTIVGGTSDVRTALSNSRIGLSLATGDFNSDGTQDLITGYATPSGGALLLQAGNSAALTGQGGRPFVSAAQVIALPVRPDLLETANVSGHGFADVLVAARGESSVYLLEGDGRGGFASPLAIGLQGTVTALASWRGATGTEMIAAGVCGSTGCGMQLLTSDGKTAGFVPVTGTISEIETGLFNGGYAEDLALIAGGTAMVIDGDTALSSSPAVDKIAVSGAVALTGGHFIYSRTAMPQLAVLGTDATLHIFSRGALDTTVPTRAESLAARGTLAERTRQYRANRTLPAKLNNVAWTEVQTVPNVGPGSDALMLHGHLSGNGQDDVVVMGGGQYVQVTQSSHLENNIRTNTPVVMADATTAPVLAAVTARTAADVRLGVITAEGTTQPNYTAQFVTNRTMNADSTTDAVPTSTTMGACINRTAGCTLRAAVAVANADAAANGAAKVDTINLASGTYSLTANNGGATDSAGSANVHLDLDGSVNIVGVTGSIVDAKTSDLAFNVNSGIVNQSTNLDVYLTNFVVQNGGNPTSGTNGYNYGGAIQADVYDSGLLTLTGMAVKNSVSKLGPGGCLAAIVSDHTLAGGTVDLETSTFGGCQTPEYGGGIDVEYGVRLVANGITVTGNTSSHSINTADTSGDDALGGGLAVFSGYSANIATSNFNNNTTLAGTNATTGGGGIYLAATGNVSISNSSITGNVSHNYGGAFFIDPSNSAATTLTADTIIGNTLSAGSDGAGIMINNNGTTNASLVLHYSRIYANTGGTHTGLWIANLVGATSSTSTFSATDNWWGCNAAPNAAPCNIAAASSGSGTLQTTPYTTLALNLSATTVNFGSPITATASFGQDSAGTIYSTANDFAYLSTSITSFTLTNTGTVSYNPSSTAFSSTAAPSTSNAAATETGTANASGTGTAMVTVDGVTVTRSYTVLSAPDLTVSSAHSSSFLAGSTFSYTLTAGNVGGTSTSGTVTVIDTLPSGFTATSISGAGWSCTLGTLTCTRNDALAASVTYPVITLSGTISPSDVGTYNNYAAVSGGGETNTANDSATDATVVMGTPTVTLATVPASENRGSAATLMATFTETTSGPAPAASISFYAGATLLGSSALSGSGTTYTTSFTTAALPSGTQSITARYPGDTNYTSVTSTPQNTYVIANNIWIGNGNSTVSAFSATGVPYLSSAETAGGAKGVAIDSNGNVWSLNSNGTSIAKFTNTGTVTNAAYTAGGISSSTGVVIDGAGQVWITNGTNSLSVLAPAGTAVSPTPYTGGALSTPQSPGIDGSGNLWVVNATGNSVTEFIGVAAPTVPLAIGVANNTTGTKP